MHVYALLHVVQNFLAADSLQLPVSEMQCMKIYI